MISGIDDLATRTPHGLLTVQQVIQKSSNIGTLKIALQMQPREMWEMFTQVGFGQKPQVRSPAR